MSDHLEPNDHLWALLARVPLSVVTPPREHAASRRGADDECWSLLKSVPLSAVTPARSPDLAQVRLGHFLVFHQGADGGEHQFVDELAEAATIAERLVNENGCQQARVFELAELDVVYRPYYEVKLSSESSVVDQV